MKLLKLIFGVVVLISLYAAYVYLSDSGENSQGNNNDTISNVAPLSKEEDFKTKQTDKDSVVESNKALLQKFEQLQQSFNIQKEEIVKIGSEQKVNIEKMKDATGKSLVAMVTDIVNKNLPISANAKGDEDKKVGYKINNNEADDEVNSAYVWNSTLQSGTLNKDGEYIPISATSFNENQDVDSDTANAANKDKSTASIAAYTIPSNSVLSGILTTGLVGRIPVDGEVSDAFRFSIKITDNAFFANNHSSKNLKDMFVSGSAHGDLLLSCVRANIDSVTFIFEDGTISEHKETDIATLSDEYGYPCIKGELITNAATYLSTSAVFSGFASAAEALAQAEQSVSSDASGNSSSKVTGNVGKFVGGKLLAGGINSANDWINKRAQSSFDVIFTPSGQSVKLLIQQSVNIDYLPKGRKLDHRLDFSNEIRLDAPLD